MCTALTFANRNCYFGRTLDLEYNYSEEIVITPRNYRFSFRNGEIVPNHGAIIGTATVVDDYPLYYEAVNEFGLCVAALNFPENARFFEPKKGFLNIASFEFIPYILSQFKSVSEVSDVSDRLNITNESFSEEFSTTPLHWLISDKIESATVESGPDGLKFYSNPVGILTNSPDFPWHMTNLANYINLTADIPRNSFVPQVDIQPYSKGLGSFGLPGDGSSASRFVRAVFMKFNSDGGNSEVENISRFFHIMNSVSHVKGCVKTHDEKSFYTVYTSCYNIEEGICYYITYENSSITAVNMRKETLDSDTLIRYPMVKELKINYI